MLKQLAPYVTRYTQVIATVTNITVEVADANLIRIAGTGVYAQGVGHSIQSAGEVYRHVLQGSATFVMTNSREHELCSKCRNRPNCRETMSICTPITYDGKVIGIIGIVCFTQEERERLLANLDVHKDFVEQMANSLGAIVGEHQRGKHVQHLLDMFLQITDMDNRGVLILNSEGMISYLNEMARKTLGIGDKTDLGRVNLRRTGIVISDMEEFEAMVDNRQCVLMGRLSNLKSSDPSFHQALVFDVLPHYTTMLSHISHSSDTPGLQSIIGESAAIMQLKHKILQIARTSSTVLITGESGTGKEMVARAIHAASDRRDKPFIPINCGAIPDALLESELFGYVRGAFTGANPSGYLGKFELAHQGVIFLDEIGAMPLYLQVKLLRVLQDMRIMRLGSNRVINVDVRIIAATNEKLPELIEQRMFRDDLYYRLNVIPFVIPPLRERVEDIPALAAFFLEKYCRLFSKKLIRPTARLLDSLTAYAWPGNVREFENIMEYLVNIIPEGGSATVGMLPPKIRAASIKESNTAENLPPKSILPAQVEQEKTIMPLNELEQQAIARAMAFYGHSGQGKARAAKALGIGIATLYHKLKEGGFLSSA